jgi:hypothetical protein
MGILPVLAIFARDDHELRSQTLDENGFSRQVYLAKDFAFI